MGANFKRKFDLWLAEEENEGRYASYERARAF
jgi:hypothetical protein